MTPREYIRKFRDEDARGIVKLHKKASESFEESEITEDFIISIAKRSDFRFFVVCIGDELIGFVGFLFNVSSARAEMGPICISPKYRKKGMGTKLLNYAMNFLQGAKVRRVIVKIKISNREALDFFRGNGFVKEGYFKRYTRRGEDVVQLRRFI